MVLIIGRLYYKMCYIGSEGGRGDYLCKKAYGFLI